MHAFSIPTESTSTEILGFRLATMSEPELRRELANQPELLAQILRAHGDSKRLLTQPHPYPPVIRRQRQAARARLRKMERELAGAAEQPSQVAQVMRSRVDDLYRRWLGGKITRMILFVLLLVLGDLTASAQVVSGYSITHQQTSECTDAVRYLLDTLGRYPHPRDWQFVVVCDEQSWEAALRQRSGHPDVRSCDIYGATYLDLHLTLLRGSKFGDKMPDPELVIAHELAHIYLHSTDEARVDMVSRRWMELARGCMARLEAMR